MECAIRPYSELNPDELAPLVEASEGEGWRFVLRLAEEWASGANRFDRPGEVLFAARVGAELVGVCGLNVDPYSSVQTVGRVRRLYVLPKHRGCGIGERLVRAVIAAASGRFGLLRVRTANPQAGALYERLGFLPANGAEDCTHTRTLSELATTGVE